MNLRKNAGFSLVELMVVVAIIGVLAAIAVPQYQRFTQKSRQSEAKSNLSTLYSSMRSYAAMHGLYRAEFGRNGFAPTGRLVYNVGFGAENAAALAPGEPAAVNAAHISSLAFCTATGVNAGTERFCLQAADVSPIAIAITATQSPAPTNAAFTAVATGYLFQGAAAGAEDVWSIDQSKVVTNVQNGVR